MTATPAQIAASRSNGLKSRGPVTPAGKQVSSTNALKHGMTAEVALTPTDSAEVRSRTARMLREMRPATSMGEYLVRSLGHLTVRVERCAAEEFAAHGRLVANAKVAFDEARIAEVDRIVEALAESPTTLSRRLRSMPEGVDRIIAELDLCQRELDHGRWDQSVGEKVSHLTGDRWLQVPVTRVRALSEAIVGNLEFLTAQDAVGISPQGRPFWAEMEMSDLIDREVERLLAIRETLDLEAIARDRESAPSRAGYVPSKEALLARRYEKEARNGVFKALAQLRNVEAEAAELQVEPEVEASEAEPSGSFREPAPTSPPTPRTAPVDRPIPPVSHAQPARSASEGRPMAGPGGRKPG